MWKFFFVFFVLSYSLLSAQDYDYYLTGSAENVDTTPLKGIVLAGGGSDNDDAMRWMLDRANEGDVVVLRASGSDGYNPYFYSELGVNVNSVETIVFNNRNASFDAQVQDIIRGAELIFLAGGDQTLYYDYWKNTPVLDILQDLINNKGITIAGTSAGMASLGNIAYFPTTSGVISSEALANPYHPFMDSIRYNDFLQIDVLNNVITDTHFDNRSRSGRLVTMMARAMVDYDVVPYAIACNEVTAVCIDENGYATVFGEYPDYDDFAYFIKPICSDVLPERVTENESLTWKANDFPLMVHKVFGTVEGTSGIDITSWDFNNAQQLEYETWGVTDGILSSESVEYTIECITNSVIQQGVDKSILRSNLVNQSLEFSESYEKLLSEEIYIIDSSGNIIMQSNVVKSSRIDVNHLSTGLYFLKTKKALTRFIKI